MKRRILGLFMLILVLLAVVFPAAAQDATAEAPAAPPVCTQGDLKQIVTLFQPLSQSISDDGKQMGSAKTVEDWTVSLLAWGSVYRSYFSDVYANVPQCIDGLLLRDVTGLLLSQEVALTSTALLKNQQVAAAQSDPDIVAAYTTFITAESPTTQSLASSFDSGLAQAVKGTASPSGFPACTAAQMSASTALDTLEKTYNDQISGLQDYLNTSAVHKATYLAVIQLVDDLNAQLKTGAGSCAELFSRTVNDIYVFNDTFSALNIGLAWTYLPADSTHVAAFADLRNFMSQVLSAYTTPATETPTAEAP